MRYVIALCALAVVVVVGFVALDPSYQDMRAEEARYQADLHSIDLGRQQLELDERRALSSTIVASDGAFRVLAFLTATVGVMVGVDMYRQRRRPLVRPDARGLLPVARDELLSSSDLSGELARLHHEVAALRAVYQVPVPSAVNYAPRFDTRAADALPASLEGENTVPLPSAPSWASLVASGWRPTADRVLLGYGSSGAVYGPISGLLSTAIAGRPGQGKSTLLRFVYAQVAMLGGQSVVWDLHGSIADDFGGADVCEDVSDIDRSAGRLLLELDCRRGRRSAGSPLLVLVDEWPALSLASKPAKSTIAKIVLEGRKYGMYALIAGQGLPADQFGGSLVRDALSSRYVFRTSAAQARMAGLEKDQAGLLSSLRPGLAVLAGPVDPQVVAIPQTTVADLQGLVRPAPRRSPAGKPARFEQASLFE